MERVSQAVAAHQGPVYVRLNRNEVPLLYGDDFAPTIGKARQVQDGKDLTIIARGLMVSRAMEASDVLRSKGLDARVLDMHTVKPIDVDAVTSAAPSQRLPRRYIRCLSGVSALPIASPKRAPTTAYSTPTA